MHERGNSWFHPAWVSERDLKGRGELFAPWMLSAPAGSWCPTVTATAAVLLLRHLSTSAANESGIWHSQQQRLCKSSLFQMHEGTYLVQIQDRGKSSKEVSNPGSKARWSFSTERSLDSFFLLGWVKQHISIYFLFKNFLCLKSFLTTAEAKIFYRKFHPGYLKPGSITRSLQQDVSGDSLAGNAPCRGGLRSGWRLKDRGKFKDCFY